MPLPRKSENRLAIKSNSQHVRTQLVRLEAHKDLIRTESLDGRSYTVAPAIILREGVHNNEFVSYGEMTVFIDMWAGKPLPVDHPQDANGVAITANSPDIIASSVVGIFFNPVARDDVRGVAGEIWIDDAKAALVPGGAEVLRKLNAGEQLEVSTAYYTFIDNVPGEWKNPDNGTIEKFRGSQTGIRPDHLALLPFDLGACSWEDGCGAPRLNSETPQINSVDDKNIRDHTLSSKKDTITMPDPTSKKALQVNGKQLGRVLKGVLAAHNGADGTPNAMVERLAVACGIDKSKVEALVNGELDFAPRGWLVIFSAILDIDAWDIFAAAGNDNADARFKDNGKVDGVSISDNKEVQSEITPAVPDAAASNSCGCQKSLSDKVKEIVTNTLKSLGISKTEGTELETAMEKKERVDALIASDKTQFSENHREWLTSLTEEQLGVLEPKVEPAAAVVVPAVTVVNTAPVAETANTVVPKVEPVTMTKEQILAALGVSVESIEAIKADAEAKKVARNAKIKEIVAIEGCTYSEAELAAFSDAMLDKTAALLQPETPFRAAAGVARPAKNEAPAAPAILLAVAGQGGK